MFSLCLVDSPASSSGRVDDSGMKKDVGNGIKSFGYFFIRILHVNVVALIPSFYSFSSLMLPLSTGKPYLIRYVNN